MAWLKSKGNYTRFADSYNESEGYYTRFVDKIILMNQNQYKTPNEKVIFNPCIAFKIITLLCVLVFYI